MMNDIISSFNAGELSPYLESRTSLEKYRSGCKKLENYLITPYGPANRRAGTEYIGTAKYGSTRCRLFGLNLSDTNKIVMEVGVGYFRFWQNGSQLTYANFYSTAQTWNGKTHNPTDVLEAIGVSSMSTLTTPDFQYYNYSENPFAYQEADLRGINICQINNVIYLTHPNYPPLRVSYWGINAVYPPVTVGYVPWEWAPMLTQNFTPTTITPSGTSGNITLTASAATFVVPTATNQGHVGAYWEITHPNPNPNLQLTLNTAGTSTSTSIQISGDWTLQTFGNWAGTLYLQTSPDGTTWTTLRTYTSNNDYNATSSGTSDILGGTVTQTTFFQMVFVRTAASTGSSPRALLQPIDPTLRGVVQITAVTSTTSATARVVSALSGTTATTTWREGAFSSVQGFPNCVTIHQSRVIYGGTTNNPSQVWGSYVGDFENFRMGAYASDSYSFTLASSTGGRINWMVSKNALLIGTTQDEWFVSGDAQGDPITPTQVLAQKESHYGSASLPAFIVNDTIIYAQRMARKLREFVYTWQSETWVSNDLTALASHVTTGNIVEMAYQRVPDALMWMVRGDGQLITMTYEREQQVTGFSRQITNGLFESVTTIQSATGEDEVWVSVLRNINGSNVRYIERFKTGSRDTLDAGDTKNWWYLDCAQKVNVTSSTGYSTGTATYTQAPAVGITTIRITSPTITFTTSSSIGLPIGSVIQIDLSGINYTGFTETASLGYNRSWSAVVRSASTFTVTSSQANSLPSTTLSGGKQAIVTNAVCAFHTFIDTGIVGHGITNGSTLLLTNDSNRLLPKIETVIGVYTQWSYFSLTQSLQTACTGTCTWTLASTTVTGLSYLNGTSVNVWADAALGNPSIDASTNLPMTVQNGSITLQYPANSILVGLPYTSTLVPEMLQKDLQDGTSAGRRMRIAKMNLKIYQSLAGEYSTNGSTWFPLPSRSLSDQMDALPPIELGYERLSVSSNWADGVDIYFRQTLPMPLTIAAIVGSWESSESGQ